MVEASRIMNLYQFIQLYKDITSQAAEVLAAEGSMECSSGQLSSAASCQASMWMGRYSHNHHKLLCPNKNSLQKDQDCIDCTHSYFN